MENYLRQFSFNDLAKSFFVINLWLPNIASPIKSQFMYVLLESIASDLSNEDKINTYEDFKNFSENILPLLPSFPMLEDYVPEADWGDIKYFFEDKCFKIFYGGDLSNSYDWYYQFEILHVGFDDYYTANIGRSPARELELCISVQNEIINNIPQDALPSEDIETGEIHTPSNDFWLSAVSFLDNFDPTYILGQGIVTQYTKNFDDLPSQSLPSEEDFVSRTYKGENCFYFFIKKQGKIFPVLPRKYITVLFDTWGAVLNEHYQLLEAQSRYPEVTITSGVSNFIKQRVSKKEILSIVSVIKPNLEAHETVFASAFVAKQKIVLIHVIPPKTENFDLNERLSKLSAEYVEIEKILAVEPVKLGLLGKRQMVQFQSSQENEQRLEPLFITCIPLINTSSGLLIERPEELLGEALSLDQLLGIFDEVEQLNEIPDFYEFQSRLRADVGMFSPMTSDLDSFGSFKDSHSVIVRGAIEPNFLMLDPHWGSNFRYRTLSKFWKLYPENYSFDHPRSWSIISDSIKGNNFVMSSKRFFAYVHVLKIGKATLFINSPIEYLSKSQISLTELLMDGLEDAFLYYENLISKLPFAINDAVIQILFFSNLLLENKNFFHLKHLSTQSSKWMLDITKLPEGRHGIRVVYNEELISRLLQNALDRSLQIELLIDVVEELNSMFGDAGFDEIQNELEKEKIKKNRYRMFSTEKKVSFPDASNHILPKDREYKLADKVIANIANNNLITEGEYEGDIAKEKIRLLITSLVTEINETVNEFNFKDSITILIGYIDSLESQFERGHSQVLDSLTQDVDYERSETLGSRRTEFLHYHQCYRYLIEKFTQLQPRSEKVITTDKIAELLALVDRLIHLYSVSDNLHYGLYPAVLSISSDFIVQTNYQANISEMQSKWSKEQTSLKLGLTGNNVDRNIEDTDPKILMNDLDKSFGEDLGFGYNSLISVQKLLSTWTFFNSSAEENVYYKASKSDILRFSKENIDGFDEIEVNKILDFLTLDAEKLLLVEGNPIPTFDLPVWEHRKRTHRYNLRPLVKIEDYFYWGAYSLDRAARTWFTVISNYKLPSDIKAPKTVKTLAKYHDAFTVALQNKIEEIVKRSTPFVKTEFFPLSLGFCEEEIGDIDVFAFLEEKNILLNIESKVIDQAFSNKDLKRLSEKIFGRIKTNNTFESGYLQKVERRAALLKEKGDEVVEKVWKIQSEKIKTVSVFVTPDSYWWTNYPPIETDVHFIEIRMLETFINSL